MRNLATWVRRFASGLAYAIAAVAAGGAAVAQEEAYGPQKRDLLIGFDATYRYTKSDAVSSSADETESFQARIAAGWFYDRTHEFGAEFLPNFVRTEAGGDTTDFYLGPYYNYNYWASPRTTLYAGPQLGFTYLDASGVGSETAFSWGVHAGMRYWVSPNVSLNVEPRLTFTSQDDAFGGDTTVFDIFFGVSFKL